MAKILLIEGENSKVIDKVKFTEEGKLQDYLEEYPSLIPLAEIVEGASALLCIGREVGVPSVAMDLLFIDKDGLLTVVETKLAKNPEARRTVIGQIIEYASYISQWTADDVYRIANEYLKSNLDEAMQEMREGALSDEDFRSNIQQNLKNGKMRLIIAVDELIEPLRAMVTFLNSYSNFDILLLQVSSFEESKSRKILIPTVFGYTPPPPPQPPTWTEERFFQNLSQRCDKDVQETVRKLYDFVRDEEKRGKASLVWGRGRYSGSFTFCKLKWDKPKIPIFTVNTDGLVGLNFGSMKAQGIKMEGLESFRITLNLIPGIKIAEEVVRGDKWPSIKANILTQAENLKNFQDAVLALRQ